MVTIRGHSTRCVSAVAQKLLLSSCFHEVVCTNSHLLMRYTLAYL